MISRPGGCLLYENSSVKCNFIGSNLFATVVLPVQKSWDLLKHPFDTTAVPSRESGLQRKVPT